MNLQQLNRSGQDIWHFLVTAGLALFVTVGTWFCIDELKNYTTWKQRAGEDKNPGARNLTCSISVRIAMLVKLLRRGHRDWVRKSEAWLHVLTYEKFGDFHPCSDWIDFTRGNKWYVREDMPAVEYITLHFNHSKMKADFGPFDVPYGPGKTLP